MKSRVYKVTGKYGPSTLKTKSDHIVHLVEQKLWLQILIALFLGSIVGVLFGPDMNLISRSSAQAITNWLALPGNLFLELIKMVVIPLVFSSIIVGILSSGNRKFLKKIGTRLIAYFIVTTSIAVLIGFSVTSIIQPGSQIDLQTELQQEDVQTMGSENITIANVPQKIVEVIPSNPLQSFVRGDMLAVVFFSIISALALFFTSKKHLEPTLNLLETVQDVAMRIVKWVMLLVPLAVFGLIAQTMATIGLNALAGLGLYMLSVLLGLAIMYGVYLLIIKLFTNKKPKYFVKEIREAQILAFSTSSSAATMPLSMKVAEDKLRVKRPISQFLIPVGATINMDGTALYQSVATIFLAQVFGIHLSIGSLLLIVAVTVGASIGAPSVPGVGIVILATILEGVGIPLAGIALILGVDRILDMCRTSINVTGDLTACMFFDKNLKSFFESTKSKTKTISKE